MMNEGKVRREFLEYFFRNCRNSYEMVPKKMWQSTISRAYLWFLKEFLMAKKWIWEQLNILWGDKICIVYLIEMGREKVYSEIFSHFPNLRSAPSLNILLSRYKKIGNFSYSHTKCYLDNISFPKSMLDRYSR